jgi:hypothetical protein
MPTFKTVNKSICTLQTLGRAISQKSGFLWLSLRHALTSVEFTQGSEAEKMGSTAFRMVS